MCIFLVRAKQPCNADQVSQHYSNKAKYKEASDLLVFHVDGYDFAQTVKAGIVPSLESISRPKRVSLEHCLNFNFSATSASNPGLIEQK